jgi:hypothetical protein
VRNNAGDRYVAVFPWFQGIANQSRRDSRKLTIHSFSVARGGARLRIAAAFLCYCEFPERASTGGRATTPIRPPMSRPVGAAVVDN